MTEPQLRLSEVDFPERERHIRVLPELRSEQVNRHREFAPAEALYFDTNFDLVGIDIPPDMRRTSLLAAITRIALSRATVLELPEPLWARFLPRNVFLAAAWTLSGLLRGKWRRARTYAIENNDPVTALIGKNRTGTVTGRLIRTVFGAMVFVMYERIAYGSESAAQIYRSLPFVDRLESKVFLELPSRPSEMRPNIEGAPRTAVFVGELAPRKGVHPLLHAWELVENRWPDAQLHVVGSGPFEAEVERWAAERPISRRYHGHLPRREVLELLPGYTVLVAPSIRWGRWREQIGLPITEALRCGLTVVTTTETGLAAWLRAHGHFVVDAPPEVSALGEAVLDALAHPLPREHVVSGLPDECARKEADEWLHRVDT